MLPEILKFALELAWLPKDYLLNVGQMHKDWN